MRNINNTNNLDKNNFPELNTNKITDRFKVIMDKYHNGEQSYAMEMALAEMGDFVHFLIKKHFSKYVYDYYEDFVQQGYVGILEGLKKYDPSKGAPSTFFNFYIMHEITRFIDQNIKKSSPYYAANIGIIDKAIKKYEETNTPYTEMDIANATGLNLDTISTCLKIMERTNTMHIESEDFIDAKISEKPLTPEEAYLKKEESDIFYKAIHSLGETEARILLTKFGLDGKMPFGETIADKDVAQEIGVSLDKVKRVRHMAVRKLKNKPELKALFYSHFTGAEDDLVEEKEVAFVPLQRANKMMDDLEAVEINF